jgi:hypothetical protein
MRDLVAPFGRPRAVIVRFRGRIVGAYIRDAYLRAHQARADKIILGILAGKARVAKAADSRFGAIDGAALLTGLDHRLVLRCGRFLRLRATGRRDSIATLARAASELRTKCSVPGTGNAAALSRFEISCTRLDATGAATAGNKRAALPL